MKNIFFIPRDLEKSKKERREDLLINLVSLVVYVGFLSAFLWAIVDSYKSGKLEWLAEILSILIKLCVDAISTLYAWVTGLGFTNLLLIIFIYWLIKIHNQIKNNREQP